MVRLLVLVVGLILATPVFAQDTPPLDPKNTIYLDLTYGRVVIRLRPDLAPNTVARFKELTRQGFYDGLKWHRVIDGFMAQTGDPTGTGAGGSGVTQKAEFNSGRHVRGAVSMARAEAKDSADSQFFIVLADSSFLDHKYTYFGEVVSGMEFVDKIKKGDQVLNGVVTNPDRIVRVSVASDPKDMPRTKPAPIEPVVGATPTAIPTAKMAAGFDGSKFTCQKYLKGLGDTADAGKQMTLGHLWIQGFLAGFYKANGGLSFASDSAAQTGFDSVLATRCKAFPDATLRGMALQVLAKETRPLAAMTVIGFAPATTTCARYTAAKANDPDTFEFASLWAFAFIQGFKNATQADMVINPENRGALIGAIANGCGGSGGTLFIDVTAGVAEKVKLK
jgi:peptidylprolyl isomerase